MGIKEKNKERKLEISKKLPLLPLRDVVVFPYMIIPLFVGRGKSINALEAAMMQDRLILLVTQKEANVDDPAEKDIYQVGTVAEVLQLLKLPDGAIKVLVEGFKRVRIKEYLPHEPHFLVSVEELKEEVEKTPEIDALMRNVLSLFEDYIKLSKKIPPETMVSVANIEDPGRLADIIAAHLFLKISDKQIILETVNPSDRLLKLSELLSAENEILEIEKRIQGRVRKQMEKTQKEYYLSEQLKAIQKELGQKDEYGAEIEELRKKVKAAKMSKEAEEKALKEIERLEKMPPMSAEATVVRTYVDWLISLPWSIKTKDRLNIAAVEKILDEDHYGLEKAKQRIVEFLAVRKLVDVQKGPILCFVGPPGVGKTSLAKSIARALGRKFVRMSLGGIRDEAEIRGHRRTYIGALPGRIVQGIKKAKSKNPVFLLDEVDKIGMDFRGDPAAALLEVLDPEQNHTFNDHYLDVDFDLSDVMFITTANVLHTVPPALQDRMEVIDLPGYTEEEKVKIAELFLVPKQMKANGLKKNLSLSEKALRKIINRYTREAGVRNLEREIATICRKVAKQVASQRRELAVKVTTQNLSKFLGQPKYRYGVAEEKNEVGVATGLAWTEVGGDLLSTEAVVVKGKGRLTLTGHLGEVMQESAQAAYSYVRSRAKELNIDEEFYRKVDIHIHVPEGAIPKDGPSAGITMAAALVSALTGKPVRKDVAMTGEITLRGRVLPVGGLKEKILAAHRAGIKTILLPKENEKDLEEIPSHVKRHLKFVFVEMMDEVLKEAFVGKVRKEEKVLPREEEILSATQLSSPPIEQVH